MKKHSELFLKVFDGGTSGSVRDCVCGRTHFDNSDYNGWSWEEGELEKFQKLAVLHPNKYIPVDGAVGTMTIMDNEIVFGCPCNSALKFEEFINQHAKQIAEYLNAKAKELKKHALEIEVKK